MINALSLRARLLLAVAAVTLIALVIADFTVYVSLRSDLFDQVDSQLLRANAPIAHLLGNGTDGDAGLAPARPLGGPGEPPGGGAPSLCQQALLSAPGEFLEVFDAEGKVAGNGQDRCSARQPGGVITFEPLLPSDVEARASAAASDGQGSLLITVPSSTAGGPAFRLRAATLPNGGTLVIASPLASLDNTLSQLLIVEIAVTIGALLAASLLGLWLVRIGLRPLREVERTAAAIAGGDLMHRVPNANANTEVGHVATALNVMLERIESTVSELTVSENRLRRFVGDASHELRTPIAAVSAYAELFERGAAGRPDDLERVMTGISKESARMAKLVDDLLTLARFDEHHLLDPEPVELVGLAAEAVETARMVGPDWEVSLVAETPVEVLGDREALRRVIDNLLANVRGHTPPGTPASVTVRSEGDLAVVEVADRGAGISADDAERLFERFFRADASRSRETGGAGLGLAIVSSIVAAHGGHATAAQRDGGGMVVRVTFPALAQHGEG